MIKNNKWSLGIYLLMLFIVVLYKLWDMKRIREIIMIKPLQQVIITVGGVIIIFTIIFIIDQLGNWLEER